MTQKKGLLGAISGALVATGLATDDDDPLSTPGPASAAPPAGTPPFSFTTPPSPSGSTSVVLGPEDQQAIEELRQRVYAIPSSYAVFARMREVLGSNVELAQVFRAVQAANPDVTSVKVCRDIDAHLQIIDTISAEFKAHLEKDRADNIDGKANEIARLTAANEKAEREIAERAARIKVLQDERMKAEQTITSGTARIEAIINQLSLPLKQAKELLSSHA